MKRLIEGGAGVLARAHRRMLSRLAAGGLSFAAVVAVVALHAAAAQAASGSFCQDQGYIPGYSNCPVYVSYYTTSFSEIEASTYYPNDGDYVCAFDEVPNNHTVAKSCEQNYADTGEVTDYLYTNN